MFGEIRSDMYMYFSLGKFWRLSFRKVFEHLYRKGDVFNVVLRM